ncbi:TonB-dependent receptor [Haliea sp. E17]
MPGTLGALASVFAFSSAAPVYAQSAIEEIVVTARKREEKLADIPVAVSAVSADDIEKRGLVAIADLADTTPGFVVSDNFSGKTDRTVQTFTLRGFSPSSGVETTVSMFIDGVPVSSTTAISSIGTPERVEILRGPQSAYFGRNTFAGAINIVNRTPADEWGGSIDLTLGKYEYYRMRGEVEGPLIEDVLKFRASAEQYSKEGAWDNHFVDGGTLGDQETTMGNLYIELTPTDNLTIKAFGFLSDDEDGPAASAFESAVDISDFYGNLLVHGQPNCELNGNPYFCGTPKDKADPLSYNTKATDDVKALLKKSTNRLTDTDMLDDYGMHRQYRHGHVTVDWDLGDSGFSVSSLTGYNQEEWILLNDIDHYGSDAFNYGFLVERKQDDFSQELRLNYDEGGKFRGTVGASYLDASTESTLTTLLSFLPAPDSVTPSGENQAETLGLFFGASYEITDALTASIEGRYQEDTLTALDVSGKKILSKEFTNFLPRFILDYEVSDDLMVYGSYSEGVNPSAFNLGLLSQSDYLQELAAEAGITLTVDPEEVQNYELGAKGSLFGGTLNYAVAAYYANWKKQINRINIVVVEPGGETATSFSGVGNTGEVDLYGLELEAYWSATDNINVNVAAAYTGSDIKSFNNAQLTSLTGISDFSGQEQPGVSEYSGNIGVQYDGVLPFEGAQPWFARADYIYKSGMWSNPANFLKTDDIQRVNLRGGVTFGNLQLQAYVDNVFDNDSYTTSYDYFAFDASFAYFGNHSGIVYGLAQPRTYGVEAKYTF